jgi:hypothetical protein
MKRDGLNYCKRSGIKGHMARPQREGTRRRAPRAHVTIQAPGGYELPNGGVRLIMAVTLAASLLVAAFNSPPDSDTNVPLQLLQTLIPTVIGFIAATSPATSVKGGSEAVDGATLVFDGVAIARGLIAVAFTLALPFVMYYAHDSKLIQVYTTAVSALVGFYFGKRTAENSGAVAGV